MNGVEYVSFIDNWAWLFAIGIGLVLIIIELLLGVDTGLDLVFLGSAFVLGGLITITLNFWVWTALAIGIICVLYVVIGRRFIHRRTAVPLTKTNIDTIIGKTGITIKDIGVGKDGIVKVGNEEWRARADSPINAGEKISVTAVSGVTLTVSKIKGATE